MTYPIIQLIVTGILISMIIFLIWYAIQAVRQIQTAEQYTHDLISGIESLKASMGKYITHVNDVHEMEMFYGDETLRELIRHGKALIETFEDYKVDYFPILEIEEKLNNDDQIDPRPTE